MFLIPLFCCLANDTESRRLLKISQLPGVRFLSLELQIRKVATLMQKRPLNSVQLTPYGRFKYASRLNIFVPKHVGLSYCFYACSYGLLTRRRDMKRNKIRSNRQKY